MDRPLRELSKDELARFARDGVVHARGLFSDAWLDRMAGAVDRVVEQPSPFGDAVSSREEGFRGDLFLWKLDPDFRAWVFESPAARVAMQVLGATRIRHFYDQLFVKRPGCPLPTPWHHDITFWPVDLESRGLVSIWISFDDVEPESSALEFVRGSHRWARRFKAITPTYDRYMADSDFEDPPDVEARREAYDVYSPAIAAGDCLIFDAHVLHGSRANASAERGRRAFASRWVADGVRYEDRHASMPLLWEHGLKTGDPLAGPLFPQVLPTPIPTETAGRRFPEPPDPAQIARTLERVRSVATA